MAPGRPDRAATAVRNHLRREGRSTIDLAVDRPWLKAVSRSPSQLLADMAARGLAHRIQRGRYYVNVQDKRASDVPLLEALEPLADTLLEPLGVPYYLSWHTALFHYGLLEQQSNRIYCAVPTRKRTARFFDYEVRFVRLDRRRFYGIEPVSDYSGRVRMATVEKALLDSLSQPSYAAPFPVLIAAFADAANADMIDARRLIEYAIAAEDQTLARRTGFLMDLNGLDDSDRLLAYRGGSHLVALDPSRSQERGGELNSRWRLHFDRQLLLTAETLK